MATSSLYLIIVLAFVNLIIEVSYVVSGSANVTENKMESYHHHLINPNNGMEMERNRTKLMDCGEFKRLQDCLPTVYSTAILAMVTAFLLSLCGIFIFCIVCCAGRWRRRNSRRRLQINGYALVQTSSGFPTSPTNSLLVSPSRFDPDPPPKYPGKTSSISERLSLDDVPPPPYTPSFSKPPNPQILYEVP